MAKYDKNNAEKWLNEHHFGYYNNEHDKGTGAEEIPTINRIFEAWDDEPEWLTADPVDQDREHANLYGGDREYCDECGRRLTMGEWGGYCSHCHPDYEDYEDEYLDDDDTDSEWELIDRKNVEDSDGFITEYSWYQRGDEHVMVFGDSDLYRPEDGDYDAEFDSEERAREWFSSYEGFTDHNEGIDKDRFNCLEDECAEQKPLNEAKTYNGIPNTVYVYHGDWADPEIYINGKAFNYYDVEDYLYGDYAESCEGEPTDEGFAEWCKENGEDLCNSFYYSNLEFMSAKEILDDVQSFADDSLGYVYMVTDEYVDIMFNYAGHVSGADDFIKDLETSYLGKENLIKIEKIDNSTGDETDADDYEPEVVVRVTATPNSLSECALTESVEDEDKPFTKSQIRDELRRETQKWTKKSDEIFYGFESEYDYALTVLKKHYKDVEGEEKGDRYVIKFSNPNKKLKESITNAHSNGTLTEGYVRSNGIAFSRIDEECPELAGDSWCAEVSYFHQYAAGITGSTSSSTLYVGSGTGFKNKNDLANALKALGIKKMSKQGRMTDYGRVGTKKVDIFYTKVERAKFIFNSSRPNWVVLTPDNSDDNLSEGWAHFEFTSGSNPYIAKTEEEKKRLCNKWGKDCEFKGNINGNDYYVINDKPVETPFAPGENLEESFNDQFNLSWLDDETVLCQSKGTKTDADGDTYHLEAELWVDEDEKAVVNLIYEDDTIKASDKDLEAFGTSLDELTNKMKQFANLNESIKSPDAVNNALKKFRSEGADYGCDKCGKRVPQDKAHWFNGASVGLCDDCYDKLSKDEEERLDTTGNLSESILTNDGYVTPSEGAVEQFLDKYGFGDDRYPKNVYTDNASKGKEIVVSFTDGISASDFKVIEKHTGEFFGECPVEVTLGKEHKDGEDLWATIVFDFGKCRITEGAEIRYVCYVAYDDLNNVLARVENKDEAIKVAQEYSNGGSYSKVDEFNYKVDSDTNEQTLTDRKTIWEAPAPMNESKQLNEEDDLYKYKTSQATGSWDRDDDDYLLNQETSRPSKAPMSLQKKAFIAYENSDDEFFTSLSDDELVTLWVGCSIDGDNPYGAAYDDEVYDAIAVRPNSRELFDKSTEIIINKMPMYNLVQVYARYYNQEPDPNKMGRERIVADVLKAIKANNLTESKQLNEGPGAGYTLEGEIKVTGIETLKPVKFDVCNDFGYRNSYDVTFDCVGVGTIEDFKFDSYMYGDTIDSANIDISAVRVNLWKEGGFENIEEFVKSNLEDIKNCIVGARVESSYVYGGGYIHSKFDGTICDIDEILNTSYSDEFGEVCTELFAMDATIRDTDIIEYVDKAVTGDNYYDRYEVMVDGDCIEDFDNESDAIEYAKKDPDADEVVKTSYHEMFNGDIDIEESETVWEREDDDFEESFKSIPGGKAIMESLVKTTLENYPNASSKVIARKTFDKSFEKHNITFEKWHKLVESVNK